MLTVYYLIVAAVQIYLGITLFRLWRKSGSIYVIFPLIVILGIIYDNLIIAAGAFIGEGELLKVLNVPRFVIHAFFTPCMMIFAFGVARRCGVGFAQGKVAHSIVCLLTVAMIALGTYHEVYNLTLKPVADYGTLRYVNEMAQRPPAPAIVTIIIALIMGVFVWIKTKKPLYFLCTLLMFILAPMASKFVWAGNLGEIFMDMGSIFGEKAAQESNLS